jgi:hypothetical protein
MRSWLFAITLLTATAAVAQHPHLNVPPKGSPKRVQLFGLVTDSLTGKPVYDCLVEYYGRDGQRRSISSVNSDGRYAMFIPANEPFELRVEKENGYVNFQRRVPPVPEGTAQLRMDLVLHPK